MQSKKPVPLPSLPITLLIAFVIIGIGFLAFAKLPDRRTLSEKIGDATQSLSNGVSDAARNLGNRTPADKARDEVKEIGDKARDSKD